MVRKFIRRIKCRLGFHVGYPERIGWNGPMTFYCTRCEKHVHPIHPDKTDQISEQMLREEGYDDFADCRYGKS